jgi:rare lipoprotein A
MLPDLIRRPADASRTASKPITRESAKFGRLDAQVASHDLGDLARLPKADGEAPSDKSRSFTHDDGSAGYGSEPVEPRLAFEPAVCGGIPSSSRTTGMSLFGNAAWYNLVGRQTASGEILGTVTATAAHRSLPLASYAKVTDLDNGRSVVVKINDRGPYTRGRILDLSPRAADALDMKRAGVAAVMVEPLVNQAAPTVAAFQTSGSAVSQ